MKNVSWIKEFPAAVTITDQSGIILEMNDKACKVFEKDGGSSLIGKNLLDCHLEPARTKVEEMLIAQRGNCYTIEKNGKKKMIFQSPWYEGGSYMGLVELSLEIPFDMPHFVREG